MLKVSEVIKVKVYNYLEISVKNYQQKFKRDKEIKLYFPEYSASQLPERNFLLEILSTLCHEYIVKVIESSHDARNIDEDYLEKGNVIMIEENLLGEIINSKFHYSKFQDNYPEGSKGRALFLLKKSLNLNFQRKEVPLSEVDHEEHKNK